MLQYARAVSNITTVVFDADDALQLVMSRFSCDYIILQYIIIDDIRRVHYLCFFLCLVEGAHRVHVQLVNVDAPNVARVDGTLSMFNMSRVHNSKSVRGRWLLLLDGLCFVGQVCHGELNSSVLSTIPTSWLYVV